MLFRNHNTAGSLYRIQDGLTIQWLDCVNIDYLRADASFQKRLTGEHGFPNQVAGRHNRDIVAFGQDLRFPNFKRGIGTHEHGNFRTSKTQVNRPFMLGHSKRGLAGLFKIRRANHRHVRQHGHHAHVLEDLVRRTVFT